MLTLHFFQKKIPALQSSQYSDQIQPMLCSSENIFLRIPGHQQILCRLVNEDNQQAELKAPLKIIII